MKSSAHETVKMVAGKYPVSYSTAGPANGLTIDRKGFGEGLFSVMAGASPTGTTSIKLQESSDDSSYADISGAAFTDITSANGSAVYVGRLDLDPRKRYIQFTTTVAGGGTVLLAFAATLLAAAVLPVSQVNTVAFNVTS